MRKITRDAFEAFCEGKPFTRSGNGATSVRQLPGGRWVLELHGNPIAIRTEADNVAITLAGWNTVTTRERLRPFAYVSTCKGEVEIAQHIAGDYVRHFWDGTWLRVGRIQNGAFVPVWPF